MWRAWVSLRSFSIAGARRQDAENPERRRKMKPALIWEIENGLALSAMDIHSQSLVRSDWYRAALRAFEDFDVLALPSAQVWPFDVDLIHPEQIGGVYMDTYHRWMQVVVPASLIGLPAISIPAGFGADGLPMGLQLIGRPGADGLLLRLAEAWHQVANWPQTRPPVFSG
jgi:amidase